MSQSGKRPLRVLLFSTLYPSIARPGHGIFVETRLRHLLATGEIEVKVIAPVPWFPSTNPRFGDRARMAATPASEIHNGVEVFHPRYFLPPKVGMNIAPYLLALGARAMVKRLQREGFDFDVIDAHYYYPDGVAAGLLSRWVKKPFVVTARGTDLNLIPSFSWPRRLILRTADAAYASIGVCRALMDTLADLGADRAKLRVFRNGVDLKRFTPMPQDDARKQLGLEGGPWLVTVGHLVERKGQHFAIRALKELPGFRLAIVGDGEDREVLKRLAADEGVSERVIFAGARPQSELPVWYSAADASLLCSSREGWANVLLESMACGTPVVATAINGTPEVVASPTAGVLMSERSAAALVDAITNLFANMPAPTAVRQYAEGFSWDETTQRQLELFRRIAQEHGNA